MTSSARWITYIVAATALSFCPALTFYFLSDDFNLIETARTTPVGTIFSTESYVYYRPLLLLSYAFEYEVWRAAPEGYHATNLGLHLINTVLVCMLAQRLLRGEGLAWALSGILFGLTPVHASSVVWVCGRTDLLCGTFYLLSILTYLIFLEQRRYGMLAVSILASICSLLCKEMAASIPLICLTWGILIQKGRGHPGSAVRQGLRASWPYFVVLAGYLGLRYLLFGHLPQSPVHSNWDAAHILTNLARYVTGLVCPFDLEIVKPFFRAYPKLLLVASLSILGASLVLLSRILSRQLLVLSAVWIGVTLLPVLRLYAPWYLYIPSVGLALSFGYLVNLIVEGGKRVRLRRWTLAMITGFHLLGLAQVEYTTMVASDVSRLIVSELIQRMPDGGSALLVNLPSEYRGAPVFGWTGNLSCGLQLLKHPLTIGVLSSVRYAALEAPIDMVVDRKKNEIGITLLGDLNFFRIDDMNVITGKARSRPGDVYETSDARIEVTALNRLALPSSLRMRVKSAGLTDGAVPLFVYSGGHIKSIE